jgi:hypothetical protein
MLLPRLPLNPGFYSLWIIVGRGDKKMGIFSVLYGVCPFEVTGRDVGYIPNQPVVEWSIV